MKNTVSGQTVTCQAVPEIRFDHMTDRALIDEESTQQLRSLSARWARGASCGRPAVHPTTARARRRQDLLQRSWRAMAELRTNLFPFPLIRRADGSSRANLTPSACISIY